ncbi:MAG TPA: cell division protein FtsA [Bdellovibrionota bacterium]|nr:cell division protein FtsA [Bdellovibrionota bacterium]
MAKRDNLVVGLDIGTTKICTIVGEMTDTGIDIVGIGTHPSKGLRKGVVINIDSTVQSIQKAVEEAELMAGCEIHSVYAGIAGGHIRGFNSHGIVAIKDKEVKAMDIDRVIDAAKAVALPMDREVLHILPQEFIVDEQDGIRDPVGMAGVRLEAKVHIVTGAVTSAQNIVKCCNRCGLNVSDIVLEQLASADAVLTTDEKELGVAMIDIGGGTTDLVVFAQGAIKHSAVLALGGNHLTNDIAVGIRTPTAEAEEIKHKFGCAMASLVDREETIEVPSVGGRKPRIVSRQLLCEIVEPRAEEILMLVKREIEKSGYGDLIASGLVITGGSSILDGMVELAERVFDCPVRRGVPQGIGGLVDVVSSPMYATGVGLVLYGSKQETQASKFRVREANVYAKVRARMREWFGEFF